MYLYHSQIANLYNNSFELLVSIINRHISRKQDTNRRVGCHQGWTLIMDVISCFF